MKSTKNFAPIFIIILLFCKTLSLAFNPESFQSNIHDLIIEKDSVRIYKHLRNGDKPTGIQQDSTSDRILDLYKPIKNTNDKLPVFLMIHGGGFRGGDKASKGNEDLCLKIASV